MTFREAKGVMDQQQPISPATKASVPQVTPGKREKIQYLPKFNVILLDDQEHTYQYVMEMLSAIFSLGAEKSYEIARGRSQRPGHRLHDTPGARRIKTGTNPHVWLRSPPLQLCADQSARLSNPRQHE